MSTASLFNVDIWGVVLLTVDSTHPAHKEWCTPSTESSTCQALSLLFCMYSVKMYEVCLCECPTYILMASGLLVEYYIFGMNLKPDKSWIERWAPLVII